MPGGRRRRRIRRPRAALVSAGPDSPPPLCRPRHRPLRCCRLGGCNPSLRQGGTSQSALQPALFPARRRPVAPRPHRGGQGRGPARARTGARLHGLRLRSGSYRPARRSGSRSAMRCAGSICRSSAAGINPVQRETSMAETVTAAQLRVRLHSGGEIAIVDARDEGSFHERHLLMASCLPLSRLELLAPGLLPRRSAPIVVCDDGEGLAERAAARLIEGGYTDVSVLAGGVAAWEAAGFPIYSGVHVPSKAFAEVVEHEYGTPWISAEELAERQKRGERHGDLRQPVLRGIPLEQHPRCRQRARGRTGLSLPGAGAVTRHFRRRQLRRAHAQHHRRAVADRRRRTEPRRLAEGRHDGLAPRRARGGGGRHRPRTRGVGRGSRRRAAARRCGGPAIWGAGHRSRHTGRMAARGRPVHPLRDGCARPGRVPRRPSAGIGDGARRAIGAGDRQLARRLGCARRAGRRYRR